MSIKSKIIFPILLVIPSLIWGQNLRFEYAEKQFEDMNYSTAVNAYLDVLDRSEDSLQIASHIAISYDKIRDIEHAIQWYDFLNRKEKITKKGLLRYANLTRMSGKYIKSNSLFEQYMGTYGHQTSIARLIVDENKLKKLQKENKRYLVQGKFISTSGSDIGSSFYDNQTIFITSSTRIKGSINRIYGWTGGHFYNLYQVKIRDDGTKNSKLKKVKGKLNTKYHDGLASYDSVNNYLYFTRDNYLKGKGKTLDSNRVMRLKIYRAKVEEKKEKIHLGKAEELPFNNNNYSCSHPSISKDGKTLYFASDMPGGIGGVDLYRVEIKKESIGSPIHLGEDINTIFDEVFPFYDQSRNTLFFASNGIPGLGGLDIFKARFTQNGTVKTVTNIGAHINSTKDDFSYLVDPTHNFGYFSSNRTGNDDIYHFRILKVKKIHGNVHELLTQKEISNVLIVLKDDKNKIIDSIRTDSLGFYTMDLAYQDTLFTLVALSDGYSKVNKQLMIAKNKADYTMDFLLESTSYRLMATIMEERSLLPIDSVQSLVINDKGDTLFQETTDQLGQFIHQLGTYKKGDSLNINITIKKEGYITKTVSYKDWIAGNKTIKLLLKMKKIIPGETELAEILGLNPVFFDLNSSYLNRPDAKADMRKVAKVLQENPSIKIEIHGNCDQRGSYKYNVWLSKRRAESAFRYLVGHGISPNRIVSVKGFSYDRPTATQVEIDAVSTKTEKERLYQLNRRTEFIIVDFKSEAI